MEIWKEVKDYEGFFWVSNTGKVKSKNKIRKLTKDKDEYLTVLLTKDGLKEFRKLKKVHRLVAEAFIPNPDNLPCVCHKDDNPLNNNVNNLWWGTFDDNLKDMSRKDRSTRGVKNWNTKLTEQDVLNIKNLRAVTGEGARKISKRLGVSESAVDGILYKNSWKHI
jgi:hypothetical protein